MLFDGLLLIAIVGLAWACLASPDDRRSVILFMALGLLLALAWGRLLAPDVALQLAVIDFLRTADSETRNPLYWAPFFISAVGRTAPAS